MEKDDLHGGDTVTGSVAGSGNPYPDPVGLSGGTPLTHQKPCTDCADKARELGIVSRVERVNWTMETLQGISPTTDEDPRKIALNVDHTLFLAQKRAEARNEVWDEMGLDQRLALVQTLVDFWPKEGVDP